MTKKEKRKFINDLLKEFKADVESRIDTLPEDWDGHEIRAWLVDLAASQITFVKMSGKRLRAYKNAVIVKNLV